MIAAHTLQVIGAPMMMPVGLVALWRIHRHLPDYHGEVPRPLDVVGLVFFSVGTTLLSWLVGVSANTISTRPRRQSC